MVRPRGTDSANQQVQSVLKKRGISMNDVLSAAQAARVAAWFREHKGYIVEEVGKPEESADA